MADKHGSAADVPRDSSPPSTRHSQSVPPSPRPNASTLLAPTRAARTTSGTFAPRRIRRRLSVASCGGSRARCSGRLRNHRDAPPMVRPGLGVPRRLSDGPRAGAPQRTRVRVQTVTSTPIPRGPQSLRQAASPRLARRELKPRNRGAPSFATPSPRSGGSQLPHQGSEPLHRAGSEVPCVSVERRCQRASLSRGGSHGSPSRRRKLGSRVGFGRGRL